MAMPRSYRSLKPRSIGHRHPRPHHTTRTDHGTDPSNLLDSGSSSAEAWMKPKTHFPMILLFLLTPNSVSYRERHTDLITHLAL